jgi:uncharacterized membrane protein YkvA (DUF1232 family)
MERMMLMTFFSRARQLLDLPRTWRLLTRLFVDGRVPSWLKLTTVVAALLIISPLDIFSDIPLLGPLDDVALLMLLWQLFVSMCPQDAVAEANGFARTATVIKNVTPM